MEFFRTLILNTSTLGIVLILHVVLGTGLAYGQTPSSASRGVPLPQDRTTQDRNEAQTPQPGQLPLSEEPGIKAPGKTSAGEDKRVFGVLPNYRTAERDAEAHSLTADEKMAIALKDSFDYPLVLLSAGYAGLYQLENNHPQFGQGVKGYARRLGTGYADQVNGNMLTEGLLPVFLREDPRYFRMAVGTKKQRISYALSRIFVTRTDAGKTSFNFAEIGGNGIAAAISLSYYSDDRDVSDYLQNFSVQLMTDAASQVMKEFWPDIKRRIHGYRHRNE